MSELSYLTDFYDDKIKRINELDKALNFVFITDQHNRMNANDSSEFELAANHIRSIQYILDRCPNISFVVNGGDVGNDYDPSPEGFKSSVREVYDELYRLSVPVHNLIGNHDDGIGNCVDRGFDINTHTILPREMHELCMKNNPTDENYYYIDFGAEYRIVFLNSIDLPYALDESGKYPFCWRLEISDRQARWFEEDALNTTRRIIVFSHAPLHNEDIIGTEGMPQLIKPYDDTLNAPRILHAISQSGNVIANITGHVHYDNIVRRNGLLTITTLCSLVQEWFPGCPTRTLGTITETAFDVFSITDDTIHITRFGAGEDRVANIKE